MISTSAKSRKVPGLRTLVLFTLATIVIVRTGASIFLPKVDAKVLNAWVENKVETKASSLP
ncbi:hypothetical protein [Prosthecobacter sp.]|uniref:hypothetical protein n=1 Tax=Prosthecobacter sp. TaxID=1965333 RepID=UPI0037837308